MDDPKLRRHSQKGQGWEDIAKQMRERMPCYNEDYTAEACRRRADDLIAKHRIAPKAYQQRSGHRRVANTTEMNIQDIIDGRNKRKLPRRYACDEAW